MKLELTPERILELINDGTFSISKNISYNIFFVNCDLPCICSECYINIDSASCKSIRMVSKDFVLENIPEYII